MTRLLMSSAIALLLATPSFAQQQQEKDPAAQDKSREVEGMFQDIVVIMDEDAVQPMLADEWIGQTVYSTAVEYTAPEPVPVEPETQQGEQPVQGDAAAPAEPAAPAGPQLASIGDVDNLVLTEDGRIVAVVVGVGGFLGLGETLVAVPYDRFTLRVEEDRSWLETGISREELDMAVEAAEAAEEQAEEAAIEQEAEEAATEVEQGAEAVATEAEQAGEAVETEVEQGAQEVETEVEESTAN